MPYTIDNSDNNSDNNHNLKTEIICIIDKSGSMNKIKDDAIGGFNQFLSEQQEIEDDTTITLNLFDSYFKPVYNSLPILEAKKLDEESYRPSLMTSLYDAIGMSIQQAKQRHENDGAPDRVLVTILTDGKENRSTQYSQSDIFEMIEEMKENNWEFIFLAANQDAMEEGSKINISSKNTMNFQASGSGMKDVYFQASASIKNYRKSSNLTNDSLMSNSKTEPTTNKNGDKTKPKSE